MTPFVHEYNTKPPPCKLCSQCCQVLPRFLNQSDTLKLVNTLDGTAITGCNFQGQNKCLTSSFEGFLQNVPPPGNMDCCQPCNRSAAHRSQWQDLELIFLRLFSTRKQARQRGKSSVCVTYCRPAEMFMPACTRPMEAACCCIQRFLRYARAALFRIIHTYTQNAVCAMCIIIYANSN